jgi:peptide/nickel transport system ATP-binding protein
MREQANNVDTRILSVKNLVVQYITKDETVCAVNDVSFDLDYGKTLGIVGETGAGKTTIARAIIRTLLSPPARVLGGEVIFCGVDLMGLSEDSMREIRGKGISMVFQDPMTALNPVHRIGRQISEGIRIHENISWSKADKKAKDILSLVGIPESRFREYPHQFSGGMKQRVVIAIALASNPDLLIADEPTSALDVTIQAQVLELIKSLQQRKNTAMILITHDFGVVAENCDNVAVVYAGQVIEYGTKHQVFKNQKHPYTKSLFAAIPSITTDVDKLQSINGAPPDPTHLPIGCYFSPRCKYATSECAEDHLIPTCVAEDGHQCKCLLYSN